jgi:predicted polyphosphate/ATP-dependent NAD kinase
MTNVLVNSKQAAARFFRVQCKGSVPLSQASVTDKEEEMVRKSKVTLKMSGKMSLLSGEERGVIILSSVFRITLLLCL